MSIPCCIHCKEENKSFPMIRAVGGYCPLSKRMARFTADVPIVFDMHVATARQSCLAGTARLTRQAPKFMPHMCLPAFFRSDPMVSNPRRIMPNVLLMAALKGQRPSATLCPDGTRRFFVAVRLDALASCPEVRLKTRQSLRDCTSSLGYRSCIGPERFS